MLTLAARALRPATLAARSATRSLPTHVVRSFTTTTRNSSGDPAPQLFGPGSKQGEVPTDQTQSTGLERFQLLGELEGVHMFDTAPLDSSRVGTLDNPIKVPSLDSERIIGCTGSPADSHNLLWFNVKLDQKARCGECGSVYALDFQGELDHHDQGHH